MSLFKMWQDAGAKNLLPPEWVIWEDFRAWAIENHFKGDFIPTKIDYKSMKIDELRRLAESMGIKTEKKTKAEIIALIGGEKNEG